MRYVLLLLFLISVGGASAQSQRGTRLIHGGRSAYSIVVPAQASPVELRAAEFLQRHLKHISGCTLPIQQTDAVPGKLSITIAQSPEIAIPDAYRIYSQKGRIYIEGGSGKGCIYAVSTLLEALGVRYYSPDDVVIPQRLEVYWQNPTYSETPVNTYRNVHGRFGENPDYRDFHKLHNIEDMFAEGYYVHTFHRLIPWQDYFGTHPEYFAEMNGKRIIDQLCPSHPEVLRIIVQKLRSEMPLQPDKKVWSVSQDDNFSYCRCEHCQRIIEREQSPAGPIIQLVNAVADSFPDKIISTLAYQYSRQAPAHLRPRENVQIMLCTIELNRSQPIAEDPRSASFLKDMEDWGRISRHIYLWDYTVDFAHSISPFPNIHTLQPNIQLFVKNNVREHFQQSNTGAGHEFSELKSYLLAKLLWNPDADVNALIVEFTDGYYGAAGIWMRKYLKHIESEILKTGEWLDIYGPPTNHRHSFLSADNIAAYNRYFDEAEQAVADQPRLLLHVREARMPLQYAMMEIGKSDMFGPRGWYDELNGDFVPRRNMLDMLETFYQTGKDIRSEPVNESGLSVEAYYQSTRRFIEVQVQGNFAFRKPVSADPLPAEKYSGGDLATLSNGVRGANDFKVHWLGWESKNFSLSLDLQQLRQAQTIEISTLWDPKSWILHPRSIACSVSEDGVRFESVGTVEVAGDQREEEVNRMFSFRPGGRSFRFVRFEVQGTLRLFDWHPSAGGGSWVFVDEVVVK